MVNYIEQFKDRYLFHQCTNEDELNNQLKELEQQYNIAVLALNNIYKTKVKELGFTELEVSNLKLREH